VIVRKCPRCGSEDIGFETGFVTGQYHCKDCGYVGPIVLEEEVD